MTDEAIQRPISCYSCGLLLRYGEDRGVSLGELLDGIDVPLPQLENPMEWTTGQVWCRLARNLERGLGRPRGAIREIAMDHMETEVGSFPMFFLKIAPIELLFEQGARHLERSINRNLVMQAVSVGRNAVDITVRLRDGAQYGREICDYNRGILEAMARIKGFRGFTLTEPHCASEPGEAECLYQVRWRTKGGALQRLREGMRVALQGQSDVVRHMEASHDNLRRQYAEISELKDQIEVSERRYRELYENAPAAVFGVGSDGRIVFANPAMAAISGHSEQTLVGQRLRSLLHETSPIGPDLKSRDGSADVAYPRLVLRLRDGSTRTLSVTIYAHREPDDDRPINAVVGIDVTEQLQLAAQVHQASKLEAIGQLAAGVAHDYNNILTAILGYAGMIRGGRELHPIVQKQASEIVELAERAAALTRQLLAFGRRQPSHPQLLDVNRLVQEMRGMLDPLIGERVTLRFEPSESIGAVRADRVQVEQIVMNLVVNARDAMPDGGTVVLRTDREASGALTGQGAHGPAVVLEVADEGVGMTPDVAERIFEPFYSTKPADRSTGLGLSTVHDIVTQCQGRIIVDSAVARGTTFRVLLPEAEGVSPSAQPAASMEPTRGDNERVLLVDNDSRVSEVTEKMLTRFGYSVVACTDSRKAMALIGRPGAAFDLLITDLVMPAPDGAQLAAEARARSPEIKVLLISGYDRDHLQEVAPDSDYEVLRKPFNPGELLHAVHLLLRDESS